MRLETKAEFTGPLADGRGPRYLMDAMNAAVRELTEDAEGFLFQRLRPVPSGAYEGTQLATGGSIQTTTGNYRRNINTKVKNMTSIISDNGVIYGPWLEGTSARNSSRFPGYASFRMAGQEIEKRKKRVIGSHVKRLARRLNK